MSNITVSNFDAKKLTASEMKKLASGAYNAYINYDGRRVRIQAPRMSVPYDAGDYKGNQKYKVQFSFRGRESNPKVQGFYKMIEDIDNFVIDMAHKNAGKWFGMAGASREMIAILYTRSIKFSKDKETGAIKDYPPTFAASLKQKNDAFDAELYDDQKRLIEGVSPVEVLRRGSEVTPILDCTGIWKADKSFGLSWKLHQARVDVSAEGASRGCVIEDDEETTGGAALDADVCAAVMPSTDAAEDEDDDGESDGSSVAEEEVVQAPPKPAPKPVAAAAPAPAVKKPIKKAATAAK
jgi:hypothetical protein